MIGTGTVVVVSPDRFCMTLCSRRAISVGSADSKNSSSASIRFVRAVSTVAPWLAIL